jgi:hypothetical protein
MEEQSNNPDLGDDIFSFGDSMDIAVAGIEDKRCWERLSCSLSS